MAIAESVAINIYYDPPPTPKTAAQIDAFDSYCIGGGFTTQCGDPVANIVDPPPPGSSYTNLPSDMVIADEWTETESSFSFKATLGLLVKMPGVYTVVIWRDDWTDRDRYSRVLVTLSAVWQG